MRTQGVENVVFESSKPLANMSSVLVNLDVDYTNPGFYLGDVLEVAPLCLDYVKLDMVCTGDKFVPVEEEVPDTEGIPLGLVVIPDPFYKDPQSGEGVCVGAKKRRCVQAEVLLMDSEFDTLEQQLRELRQKVARKMKDDTDFDCQGVVACVSHLSTVFQYMLSSE